jgi:uncharacterized protein with GYD domain
MAKYLLMGSYTPDGVKGLMKDGGAKRKAAAEAAIKSVGARMESFYFAFGEHDLYAVVDAPDNATLAGVALAINAAGAARLKTVVLLSPEDVDDALKKGAKYTPPGQA